MNYQVKVNYKLDNEELRQILANLTSKYILSKEKVSFYYEEIKTHNTYSFNEDILFYAASSIKILVCVMLLEKASQNQIDLQEKLLVTMADLKQDTGIIKYQKEDTEYTIQELIRLAIVESDNTAYIKLVNYVGKNNLEQYGKSLGATHTMEGKDLFGLINAKDMAIYWKKIYEFLNTNPYGPIFKEYLSNPSFKIITDETLEHHNFIRKYGSWDIAYHEAGIVETDNPFYLIILTQKNKCDDKEEFVNMTAKTLMKVNKMSK